MAKLMVFRKKIVPDATEFGDNVSATPAGKSIISEDLSSQLGPSKLLYQTSYPFEPGSTRVYLNGVYMTNGQDYNEIDDNEIKFNDDYNDSSFTFEVSMLSILYAAK